MYLIWEDGMLKILLEWLDVVEVHLLSSRQPSVDG
jgi:hypothetical protein